jgi:hypothetical protein
MKLSDIEEQLKTLEEYERIYGATLAEFDLNLLQQNKERLQKQIEFEKQQRVK